MSASQEDFMGSSKCPICGNDTPHIHTRRSLALTYREQQLREEFEKLVLNHWWPTLKEWCHESYGQALTLTHRKSDHFPHIRRGSQEDTYGWPPVQLLWEVFRYAPLNLQPPLPDEGVPDINEALEIKRSPFSAVTWLVDLE